MKTTPKKRAEKQERIDKALSLISDGQSVRRSCQIAEISKALFLRDVDRDQYARAREFQADVHFDEMAELEQQCLALVVDPQTLRAVIDSRKWRLARMRPVKGFRR